MDRSQIRKSLAIALFAAAFIGFTSCHRGYGCPTNLKTGAAAISTTLKIINN